MAVAAAATQQLILRPASMNNKSKSVLYSQSSLSSFPSNRSSGGRRAAFNRRSQTAKFGEVCGETAAECAAVCCCCPCGIVDLFVLAIYKVPAGLCRRAIRNKRRQRLLKKGSMQTGYRRCQCGCDPTEMQIRPMVCYKESEIVPGSEETEKAVMELEKEMWETFYAGGFWRSISQREENQT